MQLARLNHFNRRKYAAHVTATLFSNNKVTGCYQQKGLGLAAKSPFISLRIEAPSSLERVSENHLTHSSPQLVALFFVIPNEFFHRIGDNFQRITQIIKIGRQSFMIF